MYSTNFPIRQFNAIPTPFYFYDLQLLDATLAEINSAAREAGGDKFCVHYAIKANANPVVLNRIAQAGLGADCVSMGEIIAALSAGIDHSKIVFAGVGKTDEEIIQGLKAGIAAFNIESIPEIENIQRLAAREGTTAHIAIRVNPDIDAHTHHYITTGLAENKFGIDRRALPEVIKLVSEAENLKLVGLHFHIGSQITDFTPFKILSERINTLVDQLAAEGIELETINVGGGLGIDYDNPDANPIPDFKLYFQTFADNLKLPAHIKVHFELGRAVVAQCGSLITRVLYVKEGFEKKFVIVDAGMSDLIRPALYEAYHAIENITNTNTNPATAQTYDIAGPICESSDVFGTDRTLPTVNRGNLLAIRSAGAYGEVMASHYNLRSLPPAVFSN